MKIWFKHFAWVILACFYKFAFGNEVMKVSVDLTTLKEGGVNVVVTPPAFTNDTALFTIPEIIPGTYMKVNYIRNYNNVMFTDRYGKNIRAKRINSQFVIYGAKQLATITYQVKQSFGSKKLWDNIIPCGGTVFSNEGFLINFQLITGYFIGYEQTPIEVSIKHAPQLFGSTAQKLLNRSAEVDRFYNPDYATLIDNPIIYHLPDTASFEVGGTKFKIAVHNPNHVHTADSIKPYLHQLMDSLHLFMGQFAMKEYHFMWYLFDGKKVGFINKLALNAALEHRQSYMLTGFELKTAQSIVPFLNYITAHEFLHTWVPLNIHSNKTEPYPFNQPENLSAHLWLHEGITDYLAAQFCEQYGFPTYNNLAYHISAASKAKKRSFAESSKHIAESHVFNFVSKIMQIGNAYSRGQVLGFCLDVELLKLSNGTLSLNEVMKKFAHEYHYGKPFEEEQLFKIIASYSFPQIEQFLITYVQGEELPLYKDALKLMGKEYIPEGKRIPSYGKLYLRYDKTTRKVIVVKSSKNTLGLQMGDSIDVVQYAKIYRQLLWPDANDTMTINVKRNNEQVILSGRPIFYTKNKDATIVERKLTEEQALFKSWYWRKRKEHFSRKE